jgi:tetratricopeptide (TPR) repeat protein
MQGSGDKWDAAQEGAERLREGDAAGAQRVLERLIGEQPDNEYAYFFLGSAHYEQARYHKALRAYVSALELAPNYLGAMVSLGHTLRMLQRYDQAIRMAKQVLARDKHDPDALFLLGATHFARGDNRAALDYLMRFLATSPELEVATEAQGMLQVIRGEVVPAVDDDEPDN